MAAERRSERNRLSFLQIESSYQVSNQQMIDGALLTVVSLVARGVVQLLDRWVDKKVENGFKGKVSKGLSLAAKFGTEFGVAEGLRKTLMGGLRWVATKEDDRDLQEINRAQQ